MSSNQKTQARSMNGIIDFEGENINATSITAETITTQDLEITNNLLVATKNISPVELSFLDNATSNIQDQLDDKVSKSNVNQEINGNKTFLNQLQLNNGILVDATGVSNFELKQLSGVTSDIQDQLDNKVNLTTTQTIGGNKTFSDEVSLNDDLIVNSTNISPTELSYLNGLTGNIQDQLDDNTYNTLQIFNADISLNSNLLVEDNSNNQITISPLELSYLDGLQDNIQTQLDNAGISNAMTLNTRQTATGQKTFTQPLGFPSVVYSNQTGSLYGIKLDDNTITSLAESVQGVWTTGTSVVNGIDATSVLTSVDTFGTNYVGFNLTDNQTKQSSFKSTFGYVNDSQTGIILLDATNLVANNNPSIPLSPIPSGLIFPRWDSSTYITQADFLKTITNNEITLSNQSLLIGVNYYSLVKQKSTLTGYLKTSNQIVKDQNDSPNTNDFLEESNLSVPTMISSINGNVLNLTSTNTAQTSTGSAQGYFSTTQIFFKYSDTGSGVNRFVKGNNTDGTRVYSIGSNAPNGGDYIIFNSPQVNTYVTPVAFTRTGYIDTNQTIIIKDTTNIVLNQSVSTTAGSGIYEGWNFIQSISNNEITFNNANAIPSIPTRNNYDGYLYSNSELITSGTFNVNDFVANTNIGSKITQAQGQTGQVVILNETATNTPTPNNKTYNGFSPNATTFYFRDNTTNVDINYYLKDNSIPIPSVNHLITNFDNVEKSLTTSNLPNTPVSNTYNGYANINLNQIITTTSHNASVDDGIFSNMNTGIRFVSALSPEYYQGISVYGSLVFQTRLRDTQGVCAGDNLCVVYDPNQRLVVNDFLVDYDSGGLIPPDCIITSITSIGFDFYNVEVSSQGSFTQNTQTRYNTAFRPQAGQIAINATGLNDNIWKSGSAYRFITGVTADSKVYTTNDTATDFAYNDSVAINIICEDNTRHLLWYYINNTKTYSTYSNKYLTNSVLISTSCFAEAQTGTNEMNGSSPITIQNLTGYTDFNYGNGQNNPYFVGYGSSSSIGNAYLYNTGVNGIILLLNNQHGFNNPYQPITGDVNLDISIINNPNLTNNVKAKRSRYTGLILNQTFGGNQTGNAPIIAGLNPFTPASVLPTQAPNLRYLYTFYPPNTPLRQLIFTQPPNVTNGSFVIVVEPNFRIQSCTLQFFTQVNIGGTIYYQYQLSQAIYPPHPAIGFQMLPTISEAYNLSNPKGLYTFNGMMFRPSLAGNGMNLYHDNLRVDIPNNQSEYEVVDPQPLSIYKSLDSYNSYQKSTFQQITPITNFEFKNSETIEFYDPVSYDLFTGLSIDFYNTSEYTLNSDVDLTFPLLPNDTKFVMGDAVQDLYNKTLYAPTFRNDGTNYPTFSDGIVLFTGTNTSFFYDNQLRIQSNQSSTQNVLFRTNDTLFYKRPYSTDSIHLGGSFGGGNHGYNQKVIIGDDNWTFGVDNGVRGLTSSQYFPTIAFYGSDYDTRKFRLYNSWNANTIFVVDRDGNVELGNTNLSGTWIGYVGYTGYCGFQHSNLPRTGGNYALLQSGGGNTYLNASAGGNIYFRRNNSTYMDIDAYTLHIRTAGIAYDGTTIGNLGRNQIGLVWGNSRVYGGVDNVALVELGVWSDRRTKKNIVDYSNGLNDIMKLRPRKYNIIKIDTNKCDLSGNNCIIKDCCGHELHYDCSGNCIDECCEIGDENVGLILDEVKEHFPEYCIGGDENSLGSVSYLNIVPMLIQAVQDQQKQIEELQKQINSLLNV